MALGNRLKQILNERGITVKDFAAKIGVPPTTLYSFIKRDSETGKLELIAKICDGLNMDISKFLTFEEKNDETVIKIFESAQEPTKKTTLLETLAPGKITSTKNIQENKLLSDYRLLNGAGQLEAVKRVEELTEIPRYTEPDQPHRNEQLNAAHKRTDIEIPDGVDTSENDIMDDKDF